MVIPAGLFKSDLDLSQVPVYLEMSDNEGAGTSGTAGTAEELNLPKATVAKLVSGQLLEDPGRPPYLILLS